MAHPKIIIVGAGFGGLELAKRLAGTNNEVLLIDKMNHHLFQPLLYQVATCALSPGDIATPVRHALNTHDNVSFIMGTVSRIDKQNSSLHLECGMSFAYDTLVIAAGARHSYFGNDQWEKLAPGIKTLHDASILREKILVAFEKAERADTHEEANRYLRFAIVGAGPTGVELAGSLAEIAFKSLVKDFTKIKLDQTKIFLVEGASQVLPGFPEELSAKAKQSLEDLGVTVLLNQKVTDITPEGLMIGTELLAAPTVIWAAGNEAAPLLKTLDTPLDRQGRAIVDKDLSLPSASNIFVIGDAAHCVGSDGKPLPGLAPVAKQQGRFVSNIIKKNIPKENRPAYSYKDKGSLATIGKGKAVGMVGKWKISGFMAWFFWSFIHVFYLIGFKNRLFVLIHWSYSFFTNKRSVELITRPIDKHGQAEPLP